MKYQTINSPISPSDIDWSQHFPNHFPSPKKELSSEEKLQSPTISYVDVGCGFGGLLFRLSELWPNKLGIGLEIRYKAVQIVQEKLQKLRNQAKEKQLQSNSEMVSETVIIEKRNENKLQNITEPMNETLMTNNNNINDYIHMYDNISVIQTNAMKFFVHYFPKSSLDCMFFCFPDPHFKPSLHRRRIISVGLLDYYAYLLKDYGLIYNVTDVKELYEWTVNQFMLHPLFQRLEDEEIVNDPVIDLIVNKTNEAERVNRNKGNKYYCVYRRIPNFN